MPRHRALTSAQLAGLLALPAAEADLVRHWTLDRADLVAVERHRGDPNRLGFALQLCASRYPGRLLRRGEPIPEAALRFVAEQVDAGAEALADYAKRPQTRREQLDALREAFGFRMFGSEHRRATLAWLLPIALATTDAATIAAALLDELRRHRIVAPGPSVLEYLISAAMLAAERHVAAQLTRDLAPAQTAALDALLGPREGTPVSVLAWARQPPGAPGHRALARLVEQFDYLRAIGLDPALADGVAGNGEGVPRRAPCHLGAAPGRGRRHRRGGPSRGRADQGRRAEGLALAGRGAGEVEALAERLYGVLPGVHITSLLAEVDRWTSFGAAFTHLRTGPPADDRRVVLTAVLADATNLGLTRMADACDVASRRQLAWTAGWHLREETYRRALAVLVNAQGRQPLAAHFGPGIASSSDGQHFPTAGPGEAVGATNARYGRDPSVLLYTHISDRYAPFHTKVIAPAGEAAHVIDGLLYHEADLITSVHYTDGGGVSDQVFGLAHLLGFRFAPRIPNFAERRLHAFGPAATWPALAPFLAGRPDEALIAAHWDDLLRLAASVRTGVVSASLMLKRLGAYPRQNGLALALREVGRIARTLHTLDWLQLPALRRQAAAELNKGEARNALARAVCFHRLGRLRDRTVEAQQHRASGLTLVTAAIALWNSVYLNRALEALRRRGEVVPETLLAHLAPLGWQHINLTGDYLWDAGASLSPDDFRPLRGAPTVRQTSEAA